MKQLIVLFILVLLVNNLNGQENVNNNLTLNRAIEIGLKNNPEIKSATDNISASKGRCWSGISLPQPEIGVSYEYAPATGSLSNYGERTFEARQSFEFPTKYFLKGNKHGKEEQISIYKLNLAQRIVLNPVKPGYYKILVKP